MNRCTAPIIVAVLACLAAGPATQPTNSTAVVSLIADAPEDVRGPKGKPWTQLQKQNFGDWFKKKMVGQSESFSSKLQSVERKDGIVHLRLSDEPSNPPAAGGGVSLGTTYFSVSISPAGEAEAAKLSAGEEVAFRGTIQSAGATIGESGPKSGPWCNITLRLKDAEIVAHSAPAKKKGPRK